MKEQSVNWFELINERLRDYSEGDVWSNFCDEIMCKSESAASALADLLEQLYYSQDEDITVCTG